ANLDHRRPARSGSCTAAASAPRSASPAGSCRRATSAAVSTLVTWVLLAARTRKHGPADQLTTSGSAGDADDCYALALASHPLRAAATRTLSGNVARAAPLWQDNTCFSGALHPGACARTYRTHKARCSSPDRAAMATPAAASARVPCAGAGAATTTRLASRTLSQGGRA